MGKKLTALEFTISGETVAAKDAKEALTKCLPLGTLLIVHSRCVTACLREGGFEVRYQLKIADRAEEKNNGAREDSGGTNDG